MGRLSRSSLSPCHTTGERDGDYDGSIAMAFGADAKTSLLRVRPKWMTDLVKGDEWLPDEVPELKSDDVLQL
jgi:hypothetical protein